MTKTLLTSALILGSAVASQAATVSIIDGGFQNSGLGPTDGWSSQSLVDWTHTGNDTGVLPNGYPEAFAYLNATGGSSLGSLSQEITSGFGSTVSIGDVFTLGLDIKNSALQFDIRTAAGVDGGVSLIGGPQSLTGTPGGTFSSETGTGTVDTASSTVFLVLSSTNTQSHIDNVSLDVVAVLRSTARTWWPRTHPPSP